MVAPSANDLLVIEKSATNTTNRITFSNFISNLGDLGDLKSSSLELTSSGFSDSMFVGNTVYFVHPNHGSQIDQIEIGRASCRERV